jgi:predicted SAM-dependent methyltransferase
MKINLGCGNDIRSGYINIDRLPPNQMPPDVYRQGDIQSLDWLTEDGCVEEILAMDCLEYLPINVVHSAIANWANKLVSGGVLKILVPDCHAVAKAFSSGQLNLSEYLTLMFGTQNDNDKRLSAIDVTTLFETLRNLGLSISLKRYEGVAVYVEATK